MTLKITKDDILIAELEMKRLNKKAADARFVYRFCRTMRHVATKLDDLDDRGQKLVPAHLRKVAAMRKSGELDEAKAKHQEWLDARHRQENRMWGGRMFPHLK
jgi:hypothetical protein